MGSQPQNHTIRRRPVPSSSSQQEQAPPTLAGPSRQNSSLEKSDLLADGSEDDLPPPAYGDIYGEIRSENDGLGTRAQVTDDGRVNIRINQLNRRLSQVFTPALRQQIQSVERSSAPPPAYIPPSLGGDDKTPPPPPLNVVIQVVGSHGDVQPFVALGKVLQETYHHRVRLATHPNFKKFVQDNGLEFFNIGGDPSRLMAFMVKNPSLMPSFRSLADGDVGQRRKDVAEYLQGCWRSCYEAGDGMDDDDDDDDEEDEPTEARPFVADCIIANPPSFAHIHCAEKLGIPLHIMFTMPYSPTQAFPHPLANVQSSNADPQITNFLSYTMIELLSWQGLGNVINRFRKKCLGLNPVGSISGPGMLQRLKIPHTYCWSPALIPKPKDWGPQISIAGFYFLTSPDYTPAADLQAFLDAGPPPVYIGFGSIVLDNPEAMTRLILDAAKMTGQRILLSRGWGGIGSDDVPEHVFLLGSVPHDWLFKHVSCVVHHGGAGTTSAGIAAGRPTVVVPFFGDQPFWGAMVARAGAGPHPIPHKKLTADRLAEAINFCLKPESLERARELASKIAAERGCDVGAQSFHQYLEPDRLRCTLAPSRAATWRIKHTKVGLSGFAATTLANADLIDFKDLRLFRSQEHYTDEGPTDPISGVSQAVFRAIGGMALGMAEAPTETVKLFKGKESPRPIRQVSKASVPTLASQERTTSRSDDESNQQPSQTQSRSSLNGRPSLAHFRTPSKLSETSSLESSSTATVLQRNASSTPSASLSQTTVSSRKSKDRDLMRHDPHKSKGVGRFAKALFHSPMEMSVGITKGFHNAPKMWGDDTVRPQERVMDMKSGMVAVGREFGFGWYDGLTGMVTQPWRGAQKEGPVGFFKGVGKGVGGLLVKPWAASMGLVGYSLKGIHKEVQKQMGHNVQSYIVASRAAQGYDEWLQSDDQEKASVIERWKVIQKYLKRSRKHAEMRHDLLKAHGQGAARGAGSLGLLSPTQSLTTADGWTRDAESEVIATDGTQRTGRVTEATTTVSPDATAINGYFGHSNREASYEHGDTESFRSSFRHERTNGLHNTLFNCTEQQTRGDERVDHEAYLNQAIARNLQHQGHISSSSSLGSGRSELGLDDDEDDEFDRSIAGESFAASEKVTAVNEGPSNSHGLPPYDPGHLGGVTRSEFEARGQQREKTAQEKTEEEIVLEYIKKQSLMEVEHHEKRRGKARATPAEEEEDDEDLQRALKESLRGIGLQSGDHSRR